MANLDSLTINDSGYLGLPRGTTAERPGSPSAGYLRYNTDIIEIELFNGSSWEVLSMSSGRIVQVKTASSGPARQGISSTSPVAVSGLSVTITPKYANSVLVIEAQVQTNMVHVSSFGIFKDGSKTVSTSGYTNNNESGMQTTTYIGSTDDNELWSLPIMHSEVSGTTNSRTYQVYGTAGWSGSSRSLYVNNRASNDMAGFSHMVVTEILNV